MSDKIIIELELLTPMKYEEVFWKDMVEGSQPTIFDIQKPHRRGYRFTNIAIAEGESRRKKIQREEDYIGFEKIQWFGSDDRSRIEFPERYELRGLHKQEFSDSCNLYYRILNLPKEGFKRIRQRNNNIKCFVKPTNLDDDTIETFADMFIEL
jgi:hypothetical protein